MHDGMFIKQVLDELCNLLTYFKSIWLKTVTILTDKDIVLLWAHRTKYEPQHAYVGRDVVLAQVAPSPSTRSDNYP